MYHPPQPMATNPGFLMHPPPMTTSMHIPQPMVQQPSMHHPTHSTIIARPPAPTLLSQSHHPTQSHPHHPTQSHSHDAVELARMKGVQEGIQAAREKKWRKAYILQKEAALRQGQIYNPHQDYQEHPQEANHHIQNHQQAHTHTNTPTLIASTATTPAAASTSTETEKWKDKHKGSYICKKGFLAKKLKKIWKRGLIYLLIFICMVAHIAILRQSLDKINLSQNQEDIKNKIIGVFIVAIIIFIAILGVFIYCFRYITLFFLFLTLGLLATAITNIIFLIQLEYN